MEITTKTDRFIEGELRGILRPGETPVAFGYLDTLVGAHRGIPMEAFHAALTNQRLILIRTAVGAFGNLLQNNGVRSLEPGDVKGVSVGPELLIELADDTIMTFRNNRTRSYTSSQGELFDRLEPFFGRSQVAEESNLAPSRALSLSLSDSRVRGALIILAVVAGIAMYLLRRH
jgi:hypothetical protein